MKRVITLLLLCAGFSASAIGRRNVVVFDFKTPQQTMHSFGASDCWRVQYIGRNWPIDKREKIADLLFCSDFDDEGNPRGIGLSMWRFNIGSGSHEAGDKGGVDPLWRRTECFLDKDGQWDWTKQEGQRWMLKAAKDRGVRYTLGFSITAPYFMTKNGMARASEKNKYANLREDSYRGYAAFMAEVATKLEFDYLSPINEPQWEWVRSNQEGMQATNEECSRLIRDLDRELCRRRSDAKIVFGEAGDIRYLYRKGTDKPDRDNQLDEMFAGSGKHSISGLSTVAPIVSGHSYWSTWPIDTLVQTRKELKRRMEELLPGQYTYWQTEYCPMERNADNPQGGGGRDLGMNTALYIARVIHYDLTVANASSWQFWTAFSEWNYKDGLIFIDDGITVQGASRRDDKLVETCKYDGVFRPSKTLWALGNYSLFVRPGMVRLGEAVSVDQDPVADGGDLMASAYADIHKKQLVVVLINYSHEDRAAEIGFASLPAGYETEKFRLYETSENRDLAYRGTTSPNLVIPARSVVTLVSCAK